MKSRAYIWAIFCPTIIKILKYVRQIKFYQEQLSLYIFLFRGREDIYARRWEKAGKSGYAPAYKFAWNEYLIFKS